MWYNICNKQKNTKKNPGFAPQPTYTHPMLLLNPPPWKVIFHAIYPELCRFAGGTYCSIDAEKISILYLYLSKDIMKPYLVEMILGLFPIKNYLSTAVLLSVRMTYKFKLKVHDIE